MAQPRQSSTMLEERLLQNLSRLHGTQPELAESLHLLFDLLRADRARTMAAMTDMQRSINEVSRENQSAREFFAGRLPVSLNVNVGGLGNANSSAADAPTTTTTTAAVSSSSGPCAPIDPDIDMNGGGATLSAVPASTGVAVADIPTPDSALSVPLIAQHHRQQQQQQQSGSPPHLHPGLSSSSSSSSSSQQAAATAVAAASRIRLPHIPHQQHQQSPVPVPASTSTTSPQEANAPVYYLSREIYTVPKLWEEWTVGLHGQPSVMSLEEKYKTSWRPSASERVFFCRRKTIIDEIHRRRHDWEKKRREQAELGAGLGAGVEKSVSVDEVVREMENERLTEGLSLHKLGEKFKRGRRAVTE